MFSKTSKDQTTSFTSFFTIRAIYADDSYWDSDAQDRAGSRGFFLMTKDALEKAVGERLDAILESIRKIKAKTAPTRYRASISITAKYPDGRQAQRFLDKTVASQINLINLVRSWVPKSLNELQEIGCDDI